MATVETTTPEAVPSRARWLGRRMTPNLFSICFGLAGLAEVWQASVSALGTPQAVPDALNILAAVVWVGLVAVYAAQGMRQIRADLHDPVFAAFPSLAFVTGMLLSAALSRHAFSAGRALVVLFFVLMLLLGGWLTGQWMAAPLERERMHPGYFLPTVAGGFIGAATTAQVGLHGLAQASFGIGVLCWVMLGSVILGRLFFTGMLPPPLIPTLAIELAPPAVGGLAYFTITGGRTDMFAAALAGYTVLMALVQLRFVPLYRTLSFSPAFWAFAFSYAAAFTDGIVWMDLKHTPGTHFWTVVILVVATGFIGAIAVRTVPLLLKGALFPAKAQPVPAAPAAN
ncbi:MAG TPA: hypothetical protein VFU73_13875 [Actinocrinis sp.]|nr:hypothetical protein [Actinocrinis sp.]